MNTDKSLSILDRFDLKISEAQIDLEFSKVKYSINSFELVKKSSCLKKAVNVNVSPSSTESKFYETINSSSCDSAFCHDEMLFDTLQCSMCMQPP